MAYNRNLKDRDAPPTKTWRVQAVSTDGVTVTLGRYDTEASAELDRTRILDGGFYKKVKIVEPPELPDEPEEGEGGEESKESKESPKK